jgi:hypothetical protein
MTDTEQRVHRDTGDPAPAEREVPADTAALAPLEIAIAAQVRALRRATDLPGVTAGDFRYSRFAEGDPLISPHPYTGAGTMRRRPPHSQPLEFGSPAPSLLCHCV